MPESWSRVPTVTSLALRGILGAGLGRSEYLKKHPRLGDFRADGLAHYYDLEPESFFVAECNGEFAGNLLGAVDSLVSEQREETYTRRLRRKRLLSGAYGLPIWLVPLIRTDRARPVTAPPDVDFRGYPAHLHIGVKREWRRKGVGTSLMNAFEDYLRTRNVPGYHIYASSYHHEGVSFFRKLGLSEIGDFAKTLSRRLSLEASDRVCLRQETD